MTMSRLPYRPNQPGSVAWAAKRIEKILDREEREARKRRAPVARPGRLQPGPADGTTPAYQAAPVSKARPQANPAFAPRWHGDGLLNMSWSPPMPSQTAVPRGAAPRLERVAAPVPAPFPLPFPLPPVAIPGTPENQAFSDSVISLYKTLKKILSREYDEDCEQEWAEAYKICLEVIKQGASARGRRGITGGYLDPEKCARGLVSERCGGNAVNR